MKNILVIGSSNIDRIIKLDRLPEKGETIGGGEVARANGGKGANQAVAAARAGGKVVFSSCLGNDFTSNSKILNYKMEGIETKYIFKIDKVETGSAFILVDNNGENMIAVAPGANGLYSREYVDQVKPAIDACEYILLQFEIPIDTIKYIIDVAYAKNKKIILNAAPAQILEDNYLSKLHVLVVNQTEASILSGVKINSPEDIKTAAQLLQQKGPKTVIVTLGSKGSYIVQGENFRESVDSFKVKAVDATAAGDTYCGALTVALSEGKPIKDAVRFASAAAAVTVTKMGAQTSIPKKDEIMKLLT